jgi:hypothetical protein
MKVVSTGHGDNSGRGGEEVVATNRAVVLHGAWMAFVRSGARDGNANIAFLGTISDVPLKGPGVPTLQWEKSLPRPSPLLQIPQSGQW